MAINQSVREALVAILKDSRAVIKTEHDVFTKSE